METRSKTTSAGLLLALSLAFVAPLRAEQNPAAIPPLVNLNVTAVDSQGLPVPGLRAEDFQVVDNGKPRKIVMLRPVHRKGPPATFILIDLFNADFTARGISANEIVRTLEKLESADNVYLYLLTSAAKIFAIHAVVPAGAASTGRQEANDGPWTSRIKPMLDDALRQVNGLKSGDSEYPQLRIMPTWKALSGLTAQFAEVPGPKSFVWITQGVLNGFEEPGRQFHVDTTPLRIFAANLNTLETAIFTVQQRPSGSLAAENEGSPGDTLAQLTALTGGRAYPTDNTEQAITQAMSGARRVNYRMAFSPDRLDGKYHKIRVTAARKDIKIQTAERYYAIAAPDIDAGLLEAIGHSPFDYPEIGVTEQMTKVAGPPEQIRFAIHVDGPDVLFLKEGTRYHARLTVALVEYGPDGVMGAPEGESADLDMSEEEYAKAMTGGIDLARQERIDEKIRQVRVVVLDSNSNLAGTVTMPISRNP
jgi:VWFA-related protein